MSKAPYSIGEVSQQLSLSSDTLRYYEKLGLLPGIPRTVGGIRSYREKDLSRLRFIQRAKSLDFSLEEIGLLLTLRDNPQQAKAEVKALSQAKLAMIAQQLKVLTSMQTELTLLLNLCNCTDDGCPIIDSMADDADQQGV